MESSDDIRRLLESRKREARWDLLVFWLFAAFGFSLIAWDRSEERTRNTTACSYERTR